MKHLYHPRYQRPHNDLDTLALIELCQKYRLYPLVWFLKYKHGICCDFDDVDTICKDLPKQLS